MSSTSEFPTANEHVRPALPPRPTNLSLLQEGKSTHAEANSAQTSSPKPQLQASATTAVSRTDIQTQSYQDGSRDTFAASAGSTPSQKTIQPFGSLRSFRQLGGSEGGDTASIKSLAPTLGRGADDESLLGDVFGIAQKIPAWRMFGGDDEVLEPLTLSDEYSAEITDDFYREFDGIQSADDDAQNEGSHTCQSHVPTLLNPTRATVE